MKNVDEKYFGILRMSNACVKGLSSCYCNCFGTDDESQMRNYRFNIASNTYA